MSNATIAEPLTIEEYFASNASKKVSLPVAPSVRNAAREYILAKQYAQSYRHILAIQHFRNAAELDTLSPAPWIGMAISLGAIEQDDTALLVWREVIERDPLHADALLILGIDAARTGNTDLGKKYLSSHWLVANPEPIESLLRYASLRFVFDEDKIALGFLEKKSDVIISEAELQLVETAPSGVWLGIIQQLVDLNAIDIALSIIENNVEQVHQRVIASLLTVLPILESVHNGDGSLTESLYTKLSRKNKLTLAPRWTENVSLAEALSLAAQSMSVVGGNASAPVRLYKKSVELDSLNALSINNLAWMLLETEGATELVQRLCVEAMELDATEPYILDTVGRMQTILGDEALALDLLTTAIELSDDPSPEMYEHLGDALWISGEQERALALWEKASAILATNEFKTHALQEYAALAHSVWGIMVRTPEAMYDFEMSGVIRRLENKVQAVTQGREPDLGYIKKIGAN